MSPSTDMAAIQAAIAELVVLQKDLSERMKQTDEQMKRTDEQMKRTDRKIERLISNWGYLVESLSEVGITEELERYGVTGLRESVRNLVVKDDQGRTIKEYDRVLIDSDLVVVVEAKSTLHTQDVSKHINDIPIVRNFRLLKDVKRIFGAIVYLDATEETVKYAERQGLFIIKISGEGMLKARNNPQFVPKNFLPQA